MFKQYLLEKFIPWSLKIDYKNSVGLINKEKEKFICDMYNHFANNFNDLNTYELHMFRVSFIKLTIIDFDLISIILPSDDKYHSIYILYNDNDCYYFSLNKVNSKYELIEYKNNTVVDTLSNDLGNIKEIISTFILMK